MTESQNRDLWFTLPPQQSLLVSWLFSVIPISYFKNSNFYSYSYVLFNNPLMDYGFLLLIMKTVVNSVILQSTPSTFQYTHETDQIAICIQNESLLEFTLLVPLIDDKFSARIVVIHLIALLEYVHECSIRLFNLDNPPMYNNHGAKKPPCNKFFSTD